jgi:hypothetical protein
VKSTPIASKLAIRATIVAAFILVLLAVATPLAAQKPDPALLAEINKIRALDNHTHVPKVLATGEKDDDYDALPCSGFVEPSDDPAMARPDNPKYLEAWRELYGYKYNDASPAHVAELIAARQRVVAQQGERFPVWALDKLNIEYMVANRVAMGRGLDPARFLWVPYDDALMLPFDAQHMADTPDRKFFYGREAKIFARYLSESGLSKLPPTLDEYIAKVIVPTLDRQKHGGAIAIKFEAAYLRSLDFAEPEPAGAARVYARFVNGGAPEKQDYVKMQDVLFRAIAREAGARNMAVHIHTGAGCGSYFDLHTSDPALLGSVFNDPSLRKTNFVMIHGGAGPYTKSASFLVGKPNVYLDFSEQDWFLSRQAMSAVLRDYLEWFPEKVLFGTDTFPGPPEMDWEVTAWYTAANGREALAQALSEMMNDGEITRERASQLAHMVMRENAVKLYGLKK